LNALKLYKDKINSQKYIARTDILRISLNASCEAILNRDQMESLGACRMRLTSAPISRHNVEESNWYRWTKLGCTFDLRREGSSVRGLDAFVL